MLQALSPAPNDRGALQQFLRQQSTGVLQLVTGGAGVGGDGSGAQEEMEEDRPQELTQEVGGYLLNVTTIQCSVRDARLCPLE
jgi:hypothetical protein